MGTSIRFDPKLGSKKPNINCHHGCFNPKGQWCERRWWPRLLHEVLQIDIPLAVGASAYLSGWCSVPSVCRSSFPERKQLKQGNGTKWWGKKLTCRDKFNKKGWRKLKHFTMFVVTSSQQEQVIHDLNSIVWTHLLAAFSIEWPSCQISSDLDLCRAIALCLLQNNQELLERGIIQSLGSEAGSVMSPIRCLRWPNPARL